MKKQISVVCFSSIIVPSFLLEYNNYTENLGDFQCKEYGRNRNYYLKPVYFDSKMFDFYIYAKKRRHIKPPLQY